MSNAKTHFLYEKRYKSAKINVTVNWAYLRFRMSQRAAVFAISVLWKCFTSLERSHNWCRNFCISWYVFGECTELYIWIAREILYKFLYEHFELQLFSEKQIRVQQRHPHHQIPRKCVFLIHFSKFIFNIEITYYKTKYII